ncbi:hypothetical protein ACFPK9_13375 [Rubritalea spongiae]|uniref:DUF2281 domain-containing protein n=1 Tax=Rubritalea spongiae TaxID=430797 RepID=A0ABW5E639_9BACT
MELNAIKEAIRQLPHDQRSELGIFLTHLELVNDSNYFETLRSRMNDQLEQSWKDLDEL